jgi:hypothetical protein
MPSHRPTTPAETNRPRSDEDDDETKLKPPAKKIGEGADNLRDRGEAFKRRRGTTS